MGNKWNAEVDLLEAFLGGSLVFLKPRLDKSLELGILACLFFHKKEVCDKASIESS